MPLKLYNTLTRKKEIFTPIDSNAVKMYTCGPTVYNFAHIGNFRAYIFEDLLHRYLLYKNYQVTQIMNLTDVDDKTIKGSIEENISLNDFTKKYKEAFFQDIKALNITPCFNYPAATDHIEEMVEIIKFLLNKGYAYTKDGSIYFKIEKFKDYGKLAHLDKKGLESGRSGRIDSDEYDKENLSDFVLWKKHTEKDGDIYWKTELGKGRPGWHIECSAMCIKYLGEQIDVHTGGIDNMFPHHENEIAQSESYTGKKFVNYWLHCEYLIVDGKKMSKSKGNFFTYRDLIKKGYSSQSIRYLLISTNYRKRLNFTEQGLKGSETALHKINSFIQDLLNKSIEKTETRNIINAETDKMLSEFESALDDDLNISEALAAVFIFIKNIKNLFPLNTEEAAIVIDSLKKIDRVLGIMKFEKEIIEKSIQELIDKRNEARKNKNFEESDRIRDELLSQGIILKDTPEGTVWEKNT